MIAKSKLDPLFLKLGISFTLLMSIGVFIFQNWAYLINLLHELHQQLHTLLSLHTKAIADNSFKHGLTLIILSFVYGIFHAIGPGHGKAIIVLYLGSHKESLKRGATIALLAALFQSVVAIVLVVLLSFLLDLTFFKADEHAGNITIVSYQLVAALGAYLFITAFLRQYKSHREKNTQRQDNTKEEDHQHTDHSCCGGHHAHQASPRESWFQSFSVIVSMGIRPCSGAIIVLVYAHLVGFFHYGVIATLVMGLGTGLSVAGIALGTQYARNRFEDFAQANTHHSLLQFTQGYWLKMIGGIFIFIIGMSLFKYASASSEKNSVFPDDQSTRSQGECFIPTSIKCYNISFVQRMRITFKG